LNSFLNRTLVNQQLFGGPISYITFNLTLINTNNSNHTNFNNTNSTNDYYYDDSYYDIYDDSTNEETVIMTEQNSTNELQQQQQTAQTSYTTVTYATLDKGLSITISETITITNNNLDKSPLNNKTYELILIPKNDNTKTVAVPTGSTNEKPLSPSLPSPPTTINITPRKSSSQLNLLRPIKPISDTNFAYIDESSDDRTCSSGDGINIDVSYCICLPFMSLRISFIL
jgi:hypothetical protein